MDDPRQHQYVRLLLTLMIGGCAVALAYLLLWG